MDQKEMRRLESKCIQEQPPACTAGCPLHVDVRGFVAEMSRGDFTAALRFLQKAMPFPGIIARVCDHPCTGACVRGRAGDPVAISDLERACVNLASPGKAKIKPLPARGKRVAVVGAGLSGLTAAYDLAMKGYGVVIYFREEKPGGSLWEIPEERLPRQAVTDALEQLISLGVEIISGFTVGNNLSALGGHYDAVFLGTGEHSSLEPDADRIDRGTLQTGREWVFAGGSLLRPEEKYSPIMSAFDGRRAAISIDRYLQGASLSASRDQEGPFETRLYTSIAGVQPMSSVQLSSSAGGYTKEDAVREAGRCLQCQCLECVKACRYLERFGGYPKRYVREIYNNESIVMGMHMANGLINSCSLCGLCGEICPEGLNMGEVCRKARENMVDRGKMPPSAHDFAISDMSFSNGPKFSMFRHEPGKSHSSHVFFPGCQLCSSRPGYIEKVYLYLREKMKAGVGLMLRCCGAPAEWAGQRELFVAGLQEIENNWRSMGRPTVIVACSSCYRTFKENLPEISLESLWEIYDRMGLPAELSVGHGGAMAVHDSCSTRNEAGIHYSVRNIVKALGYKVEELPLSGLNTECCGFGGLMSYANAQLGGEVAERRRGWSDNDFVAYCAMCRDRLAAGGKRTYHLLDLIYGRAREEGGLKGPGLSLRQENRARLKNMLLKEIWGEEVLTEEEHEKIIIKISPEVEEKMESRQILRSDLQKVIYQAEKTGKKMLDEKTGHFLAYFRPVSVTYWVEYVAAGEAFTIYNTYSHRMEIVEEAKS